MGKPMEAVPTTAERREMAARKPYTKEELRAMLPQVGDRRMEIMCASTNAQTEAPREQACTVVEVNEAHLWYRVRFDRTGVHQCFKLPVVSWSGARMEALYK